MKHEKIILILLVLFFLAQCIIFLIPADIWWDPAVYAGMGKYLFSGGSAGIWEPYRPVLWPFLLGFLWKLGADPIGGGILLSILLGVLCVLLTFLISKRYFDTTTSLIAAAFLAFSPTFFLHAHLPFTELPALFFILAALYFYPQKPQFAGLLMGLAILTRTYTAFAAVPLFIDLLLQFRKRIYKPAIMFALSMVIPLISFLIFNQLMYGDPFYSFIEQVYMTKQVGWLWHQPWYYYLFGLFKENPLAVLMLPSIFLLSKKKHLPLLMFLFLVIPFFFIPQKQMRVLLPALPFFYMVIAATLTSFIYKVKKHRIILITIGILWAAWTIPYLDFNTYDDKNDMYYEYVQNNELRGTVWVSNPAYVVYSDYGAKLLYYPRFDSDKIKEIQETLTGNETILLNTCDIPCPPTEAQCESEKTLFIEELKKNYVLVKSETQWICEMYIFEPISSLS